MRSQSVLSHYPGALKQKGNRRIIFNKETAVDVVNHESTVRWISLWPHSMQFYTEIGPNLLLFLDDTYPTCV